MTGEDAIEFMMAGATAVQVGTANFADLYAMPGNYWFAFFNIYNHTRKRVYEGDTVGSALFRSKPGRRTLYKVRFTFFKR